MKIPLSGQSRAAALLLLFSSVLAQAALARAESLTLEGVERRAFERSPRVQRAQAELATADAYRTFGKVPVARNPTMNLRAMIGQPDDTAATYSVTLGLPFDVSGRRKAWSREAEHIVARAEAELMAVQNEVRAAARAAYVEVATAEAARAVASESAGIARELVTRVQARLDARAATALDLALVESQLSESLADVARAERVLVEAQGQLREAAGIPADESVAVTPLSAPTLPSDLTLPQAIQRALRDRREPAAFASERDRFRAADRRLRAEAMAPWAAGLEAEQQGNSVPRRSVGANFALELPFVQRNQGERAVARREAETAEIERTLTEQTIAREAVTAYGRIEAALRELSELESRALPAAQRTLGMVRTLLEAGAIDYFRVLTAQSGAFALRRRHVEALREAWLGRIALERALAWKESP